MCAYCNAVLETEIRLTDRVPQATEAVSLAEYVAIAGGATLGWQTETVPTPVMMVDEKDFSRYLPVDMHAQELAKTVGPSPRVDGYHAASLCRSGTFFMSSIKHGSIVYIPLSCLPIADLAAMWEGANLTAQQSPCPVIRNLRLGYLVKANWLIDLGNTGGTEASECHPPCPLIRRSSLKVCG